MKVKLIGMTPNPIDIMYVAARTCYSPKSPIELWEADRYPQAQQNHEDISEEYYNQRQNKMWNLVSKVLASGHQSIAEEVYFNFAIEGISRVCSHQLTRHRAGIVFSQQSQRYVEIKESLDDIKDLEFETNGEWAAEELLKILNKYFIGVNGDNYLSYLECLEQYLTDIENGVKAEDARAILPNATKTNLTMGINLRELIHVSNLRLCTRAQKEIRELFSLIKKEVEKVEPRLAGLLVPTCEVNGVCYEGKCCGRKPHISKVMEVYKNHKNDNISDMFESDVTNEEINQLLNEEGKIKKEVVDLLQQKSILDSK